MRDIEQARELHLAGRWAEAESLYWRGLEQSPNVADGLHLLGLLHADTGRPDTALQLLGAAINAEGPLPHLCRNLGIVLERQGQTDNAIACYHQALTGNPQAVDLWAKLAELLTAQHRYREAADAWRQTVERSRGEADTGGLLAWAKTLALAGDREPAFALLQRILRRSPEHPEALFDNGVLLMQMDRAREAISVFDHLVRILPSHAEAHNNLGVLKQAFGEREAARPHYETALQSRPKYIEAKYNFATLLQELGDATAAGLLFHEVLAAQPNHAAAWTNLGNCLLAQNEIDAALPCYQRTLDLAPGETAAIWNAGIAHLTAGRFKEGWPGYERRFDVAGSTPRRVLPMPLWRGEPLQGKRIFVYAEQGLGDTLQFCRYLPLLAELGATVVFEGQPALLSLLATLPAPVEWLASPAVTPEADFQIPLLSLPAVFGTTLDTIPARSPYLSAEESARTMWRKRLEELGETLRVGLVVQGNPLYKNDRHRSIPSERLQPWGQLSGVSLINIQKGKASAPGVARLDLSAIVGDFRDTAALVAELDLVITVDTSMAHLAGALGKETWLLLGYAADWRWMRGRTDSPWYPSIRIFRQPEPGNWDAVIAEAGERLRERARSWDS